MPHPPPPQVLYLHRHGDQTSILLQLSTEMVKNPDWLLHLSGNKPGGPGGGQAAGTTRSNNRYLPQQKSWYQVRIDGGPPSRESPGKHVLVLLSQLEGYKGAKQQRCWECNELVSWCCARCSTPSHVVPLHPPVAQGSKRTYGCLDCHRRNPAGGYKVTHEACTGVSCTAKRRRRIHLECI